MERNGTLHSHGCACGHDHGAQEVCACGHDHAHHSKCTCGHEHSAVHSSGCACAQEHVHAEGGCACGAHEAEKKGDCISGDSPGEDDHKHGAVVRHAGARGQRRVKTQKHSRDHEDGCSCGRDHAHEQSGSCSCGHDHAHDRDGGCSCGHDHTHDDDCGCGHTHSHDSSKELRSLLLGALCLAAAVIVKFLFETTQPMLVLAVFIAAYLVLGFDVLRSAAKNIVRGAVFDENFLMSVATLGAFLIGEYVEGAAVMLFYRAGEFF